MRGILRQFPMLFDRRTLRRLRWAIFGSIAVAITEVIGLLFIVPLVQLLSDNATTLSGPLAFVSEKLGSPPKDRLAVYVALIVMIAFISKAALTITFRWWISGFLYNSEADTASELLRRYLYAPYWLHLERNSAELIRNMNDATSQAYSNVVIGFVGAFSEAAVIVGVVAVLLVVQPIAALAALIYFGAAAIGYQRSIGRHAKAAGDALNETAFLVYRVAHHALGGIKELQVRNRESYFLSAYGEARSRMAEARRRASFLTELPRYLLEVVFILGVALMSVAVFTTSGADDALPVLALFVAAGFRLLPSIVRLIASLTGIRIGRPGFELVTADLTALPPGRGPAELEGAEDLPLTRGLDIEDVSYTYRGSSIPVLQHIDLHITAGESIGLVGASGAGKSTLVDLLLALHRPTSGSIRVDGVDIQERRTGWQRCIGLVPQDVYLLDDSLRANIAFGLVNNEIDDDLVAEAVALARLSDLVEALPSGLHTTVGERGVRFSGGQRQRIGIARALYLRPSLLILDEATSALDNETEMQVSSTIAGLRGDVSMIIVAHRLSTVRDCDRIVFLRDGLIEATGTFDHLLKVSGGFARLVELGTLLAAPESM